MEHVIIWRIPSDGTLLCQSRMALTPNLGSCLVLEISKGFFAGLLPEVK